MVLAHDGDKRVGGGAQHSEPLAVEGGREATAEEARPERALDARRVHRLDERPPRDVLRPRHLDAFDVDRAGHRVEQTERDVRVEVDVGVDRRRLLGRVQHRLAVHLQVPLQLRPAHQHRPVHRHADALVDRSEVGVYPPSGVGQPPRAGVVEVRPAGQVQISVAAELHSRQPALHLQRVNQRRQLDAAREARVRVLAGRLARQRRDDDDDGEADERQRRDEDDENHARQLAALVVLRVVDDVVELVVVVE